MASRKKGHDPRPAFVPDFQCPWPADSKNECRLDGPSPLQLGHFIREGWATRPPAHSDQATAEEINSLKGMLCFSSNQQMYQKSAELASSKGGSKSSRLLILCSHHPNIAFSRRAPLAAGCFLILNNSVCVHYVNKQLN